MTATVAAHRLRRELGVVESYAALVGILIGAGIFRVTSEAWTRTGSSVILGHMLLAPIVLVTAVPYAVYLSTPLGLLPGGEYTHLSRTFGNRVVAFLGAWLKIVSYIGALAYLASTFANYLLDGTTGAGDATLHLAVALAALVLFYLIHVFGVRWFGRAQVGMCAMLGLSIAVLVVPGLFAVRAEHFAPLFSGGAAGFAAALPLLFFAYAGFESLAQTAAEVRDSRRTLPRVFVRGILLTTLVYVLMSVVSFGVLPGADLARSAAPMVAVASVYLPRGAVLVVRLGALLAIATSLNATFLVPSRLAIMLSEDGAAPAWVARIASRSGTPVRGLTLTLVLAVAFLVSGQLGLALNIAVLALVILYAVHSIALVLLPRLHPALYAARTVRLPRAFEAACGVLSACAMGALVVVMLGQDAQTMRRTTLAERIATHQLTGTELLVVWAALGAAVYFASTRRVRAGDVRSFQDSAS